MTKLPTSTQKSNSIPPRVAKLLKDDSKVKLLDQLLSDADKLTEDLESVPAFHDFTGLSSAQVNGFIYRVNLLAKFFRT